MNAVAIVAAGRDAQFAADLRAALAADGHAASLHQRLPPDASRVVLIWSAALEAAHSIDAQALIGLWSEDRLVVAPRDATPLPLGLRDLETLPVGARAEDICSIFRARGGVARRTASSLAWTGAVLVAVLVGGGCWYYFNKTSLEKQAALTSALESAVRTAEELKRAQALEQAASRRLDDARKAELDAVKSGDRARIEEAQSTAKAAEAELGKLSDAVKAREAAASDARRKAQASADSAQKSASASKAEKVEVAAASPKAAEAPKPAPEAPPVPSRASRAQREQLADEEAARKAMVKPSDPAKTGVASAAPVASAPATAASEPPDALYRQAQALENGGNARDAIRIYRRAARAGSGQAAKRLGEIFDRGVPGVPRDYAEALQWYQTARDLGVEIPTAGRGGGGGAPRVATPPLAPAATLPAAPAATPVPTPPQTPAASPPPAPESPLETRFAGWQRGLLIVALVFAVIYWRRARRRRRAEARDIAPVSAPVRAGPMPAADGSMLFVSYSHKDRKRVEPIVSVIEDLGRKVWIDRTDITGQTGWAGQIVRAIRDSRAVVLMASPNSYGSDQVVRELYLAMNHKKTIVPIEIEAADLPDELQYILAPFQHHRLSGGEPREVIGRALAAV
jgi:hypothetical protein